MRRSVQFVSAMVVAGALISAAPPATSAPALNCPDKYLKMIIPQPAGGVGDLVGRVLGDKAASYLGQQMVVENRPGATTVIGSVAVANARPDGCTILNLTTSGVVASVMRNDMPYDLERDLVPFVGVGSFPLALAVQEKSPIKDLSGFVAASKSADGLDYGSGGPGTIAHLSSLRLLKEIGGHGTHVPYKGNAFAIQGLMGGETQFMFPTTADVMPLVQGSKLRVLGVTSARRLPALPNVPTMAELGFADFAPSVWYAFLVPKGTPQDTISKLHEAFAKALQDPATQQRLKELGFTPELRNPEETRDYIKAERVRWNQVVLDNKVTNKD